MPNEPSEIAKSLGQKYQVLRDAFTDLNSEAARFHTDMQVNDDTTYGPFNSLCRILAFSDQLHFTLSLMRDDVRAMEDSFPDPVTAVWNEQFEDQLDDWFSRTSLANSKVN